MQCVHEALFRLFSTNGIVALQVVGTGAVRMRTLNELINKTAIELQEREREREGEAMATECLIRHLHK